MMKKLISIVLLSTSLFASGVPKDENWGIELNPTVPIAWGAIYSMGISYFAHDSGEEYALPIFTSLAALSDGGDKWQSIHVDAQYKKYLSEEVGKGMYYGGFVRWSNLEGYLKDTTKNVTENKFGLGGSIGYRTFGLFGYESLYWGAGLNVGAYVSGSHDMFDNDFLLFGDKPFIIDVEFFKFGVSY
jgi:hypothetical protein